MSNNIWETVVFITGASSGLYKATACCLDLGLSILNVLLRSRNFEA